MKSEISGRASRAAARKQAEILARKVAMNLTRLTVLKLPEHRGLTLDHMRADLWELNQRVHEFNAYENVLSTK